MADIARLGFSVDTSGLVRAERAIDSLSRSARGLRDISLRVDVSGATEAMRQLDRLDGRNIAAQVRVDLSGADDALRAIDRLSGGARSVRVDVAISGVDAAVRGLRDIERLAVNRTVRIDINTGDIRGAISDLERLAREARDAAAQINGLGANVNVTTGAFGGLKTVVGAVLGILAGGQIAQGINDVIQYNAEINLLTQSLGVSRDALQVWGNIGKSAGVDIADIFKDVNEKIAEFASTGGGEALDVFKRLNLDVKDFIALSPDQQVLKITKAMSEMKDMSRGEKTFLLESLGNDLSKILPMLDDNAAKLREIDQLMRSSGAIITAEQNANLTEAKGNLDKLALSMKGAGNAAADVGAQIVNAIAGDAMDAVSGLDDAIYRQAENVKIMADAWVYAYETASEAGHIYAADTEGWFTNLMEMERIGWTYLPVWAGAAYTAIDEKGRQWNLSAQAMVAQFRADWRNGMADMIDAATAAYDAVANIAIKTGNNIFGGNTPEQHTVVQYATDLRAAATELEGVAKARRYDAETAQYAAERAINSAAAYQVESEQRRTLNAEMGIAERQFAALGSGLDSAGKSGQQFYVNQEKVNEALKDGGDKANDAKKQVDGLIDSLTKQRIELENGKLAAEYYTNRLNGLTDAEARAAAGAGQYNAYLAERKRQQQALAGIDGGLKSGYLAKLDDLGLTQTGSVFDAIRVKTEAAIATNQRFEASLKSIGTTATAIGGTASQVVGILQQLGWTKNQAIGIAANLKQESEFRPSAVGDGGKAYGVAQWHPDRQSNFQQQMGKSIVGSSLEDQLKFLTYEMRRGNEIAAGRRLEATTTPQAAAAVVSRYYERPKDTEVEMQRRAEIATRIAAATGETASFTEKTTAALRGNTTASADLLNVTRAYSGQFDNARVTAGDITGLINTELQIATNGLLKTASDHTAEVTKTGYEYRQMQLAQMQLEPQMQAMVLAGESQAAYAEQYNALLRERAAIKDPSAIGDYKRGLSDQTLDKSQIESLTGLKLQNNFELEMSQMQQQAEQVLLTKDAYQQLKWEREGFSAAQLAGLESSYVELEILKMAEEQGYKGAASYASMAEAKLYAATGMLQGMTAQAASSNKQMFEINKAAAVANALINTREAVTSAYKFGSRFGGPVLGAAFAGVALAAQMAQVKAISSQSFNGGGSASAGGSTGSSVGGGGGALTGATVAPVAEVKTPTTVYINVDQDSVWSGKSVRNLIEKINEAVGDGATLRYT